MVNPEELQEVYLRLVREEKSDQLLLNLIDDNKCLDMENVELKNQLQALQDRLSMLEASDD